MVKPISKPPSKETCLRLSEIYFNDRTKTANNASWVWLFCWGFYDMYIEGWYGNN